MYPRGAYPADRAAALSGVPLSTVHWWARHDVLVPSVSAERVKLWSYADLMGLRIIYWLRQTKTTREGAMVPRSAMPDVRRALAQLAELDLGLWNEDIGPTIAVDRKGEIFITKANQVWKVRSASGDSTTMTICSRSPPRSKPATVSAAPI